MINKIKSDFLVSTPSFASGAGRLLDWYGLYDSYNVSRSGQDADAKAIFSDWRVVGEDINDAMLEVELEASQPLK